MAGGTETFPETVSTCFKSVLTHIQPRLHCGIFLYKYIGSNSSTSNTTVGEREGRGSASSSWKAMIPNKPSRLQHHELWAFSLQQPAPF